MKDLLREFLEAVAFVCAVGILLGLAIMIFIGLWCLAATGCGQ